MTTYTNRNEIPLNETWNLADLYPSQSTWEKDYERIEEMAEKLKQFDGNIVDGQSLYQYLKLSEELSFILTNYTHMPC